MPAKRVLIADDALDFGRMLQATLSTMDASINVSIVPSGEEAMLETVRLHPDLLVTDVRLPGISGVELVKKVRKRHHNLRIIVVTGLKDPTIEEQALAAGADRFFTKPVPISDFINAAQELLGMASTPQPEPATAQPPVLFPEPGPEAVLRKFTDLIIALRQELGAQVVLLVDGRGRAVARAGDFASAEFEAQAIPAWMVALSAGEKSARLMGAGTESVLAFRGAQMELVLAPAGGMGLVIGMKPGRSLVRLALAVEEALQAQKELLAILAQMGVSQPSEPVVIHTGQTGRLPPLPPQPVTPEPPALPPQPVEEEPEDLGDLEALFAAPPESVASPAGNLDDFWEQAARTSAHEVISPDVLSYEQAVRLGLAPDEGGGA